MPDSIGFDFSDISKLAADFGEVPAKSRKNVRQALEVTARNVKDAWQGKLAGGGSLRGLRGDVSYDVTSANSGIADVTAEVGFDKSKFQGPLGNISEFGTPTTPGRGFGLAALNENIEDFQNGIGLAAGDPLD